MTAAILKDSGYGYEYQTAAVLHDVLEDTDATEEELAVFGEEIVQAVKCLTHPKGMSEEEYIEQVLSNQIAAVVKSADKIHNINEILHLNPEGERTAKSYRREESRKLAMAFASSLNSYCILRLLISHCLLIRYSHFHQEIKQLFVLLSSISFNLPGFP